MDGDVHLGWNQCFLRSSPNLSSGYQMSLSQSLTQHRKKRLKKEKAEENQNLAFCCCLCQRWCYTYDPYALTLKSAKQTVLIICSRLNRTFSTKLTLRRHMGIHRGEKPFSCPHCPYSSRLKSSLLQHLRTHTGNAHIKEVHCQLRRTRTSVFA